MSESINVPLTIREAERKDIEGVYQLYQSLTPEDLYMRFFTFHKVSHEEIEQLFSRQDHVTLLAEIDGRIVGEATLYEDGEFSVAVDPRERRGGIGTALVAELIKRGASSGMKKIKFYTLPENYPMIRIGKKLGFKLDFDEEQVKGVLELN
ncbi:GNAT family N-acetyltransferase [Metallosphaera hakonensis]|uniref:GNAT family N-acetyltransferase n=1 Tax=Metallosphaera hakonensis JCM 8857 = DSM 7519 TaxID=1293036 RepID=A0A2U9IVZ3_9CREN|nr:GNAT family N-acetyltransferase [Metallosphaera hakonensis]AWS00251.1 GNAT family N-acetyltransferase [Metallosphaera hakonensis JCM 8857 = DSM 7519]